MIVSHCIAYVKLLSRLGIHCIPSRSCQRHGGALASSIFVQQIHIFFWCQNGLLVDRRNACWWVLFGWFLGRKVGPDNAARRRCSFSCPWPVVLLWFSALVYFRPAILGLSISCYQCWPYKGLRRLVFLIGHPKKGGAWVESRSYRWELGADMMEGKMESWALLS